MTVYMMENIKNGSLLGPAFSTSKLALDSWEITCANAPDTKVLYKVVGIPVLDKVDHL